MRRSTGCVMPSDAPLVDLSAQLNALLLHSALWLLLAGTAMGLATWWMAARQPARFERTRTVVFGPAAAQRHNEPAARRFLRISLGVLWIVDGALQAQPNMPSAFGRDMLAPGLAGSPPWLASLVGPLARTWTRHPVVSDAATVWVQVGLGVVLLVGGSGLLMRLALWASVAWGLVVWVGGEFAGGLFSPGAGWLVGAPGAVLVYVLAAGLLMAPWRWWESGRAGLFARRSVGGWILLGAALQALPWEGYWSARRFAAPFAVGAARPQPWVLRQPITALASWTAAHPVLANAVLVGLLVVVGAGLLFSRAPGFVYGGLALCAATWWLAQDFGVLGGTATDPNTALPLALVLACAVPQWQAAAALEPARSTSSVEPRLGFLRTPSTVGLAAFGIGALVVAPLVVLATLLGPADSAALAADSGGGVVSLPQRPAPPFTLTDQNGHSISLAQLRGKLTLVTFLDPVCSDECPVIANQLAIADRELGPLADRVEIVAIDTNPLFSQVSDVAAFTESHALGDLPNWHFVTGPATELQNALAGYGIAVQVPSVGMIQHGEGIYFVGPDGLELAYLGDGADIALTSTYADAVRDEIRRLLA
jgi:cytochrome oxidase Cu insertion factor (SCO1/SenC/PrrC family)